MSNTPLTRADMNRIAARAKADATFDAHSREDIHALLALVEEAVGLLGEWQTLGSRPAAARHVASTSSLRDGAKARWASLRRHSYRRRDCGLVVPPQRRGGSLMVIELTKAEADTISSALARYAADLRKAGEQAAEDHGTAIPVMANCDIDIGPDNALAVAACESVARQVDELRVRFTGE